MRNRKFPSTTNAKIRRIHQGAKSRANIWWAARWEKTRENRKINSSFYLLISAKNKLRIFRSKTKCDRLLREINSFSCIFLKGDLCIFNLLSEYIVEEKFVVFEDLNESFGCFLFQRLSIIKMLIVFLLLFLQSVNYFKVRSFD